jgi:hypothetical protein
MDRLKKLLFVILMLEIVGINFAGAEESSPINVDWVNQELNITGTGEIERDEKGNHIQWQHEAAQRAKADLIRNYILSMYHLRLDAFSFTSDLMKLEPERNEPVYNYISNEKKLAVQYTDDTEDTAGKVIFRTELPFYGPKGLASLLIDAGADTGNFPEYEGYVFSTNFTGVVIDARGLGREPAFAPRIFDEDHREVYSIALMAEESFKKWGAVQYTDDPYYKGFETRVGEKPAKFVALKNDDLIETDISLSNDDAKILLQNEVTKNNLKEGRVIIIIDKVILEADKMLPNK